MATSAKMLDTQELESRVKEMYREVAEHPEREFHFETGRELAERLGYPSSELDEIPSEAIDSFAGVSGADRGWTASSPPARWATAAG